MTHITTKLQQNLLLRCFLTLITVILIARLLSDAKAKDGCLQKKAGSEIDASKKNQNQNQERTTTVTSAGKDANLGADDPDLKKAGSEIDASKKNQDQNQERTTTVTSADKDADLGADDPDLAEELARVVSKEDHTQDGYAQETEQAQKPEQVEQTQMVELLEDNEQARKSGGVEKVGLAIKVGKTIYRNAIESSKRRMLNLEPTQGEKSDRVVRFYPPKVIHQSCFRAKC
ncbi:unnamed protein product [Toxocara canis]|uniref:Uncharacterized protein n=1 Tax=Toxocara canis TaxID=6265 RepID=A0A183VFE3_TOXCA|nr:unnamed protein product [Toxocara canis]